MWFAFNKHEAQMDGTYSRASTDGAETSENKIYKWTKSKKSRNLLSSNSSGKNAVLGISQSLSSKKVDIAEILGSNWCPLMVL